MNLHVSALEKKSKRTSTSDDPEGAPGSGRFSYVRSWLLKSMYAGSACVSTCSAWDVKLAREARCVHHQKANPTDLRACSRLGVDATVSMCYRRPGNSSTSSSQSSALVRSGSESSSQGEQEQSLGRVEVDSPQQVSYIPVFGFKPPQQQPQQLQAARHQGEADCQVPGGSEDCVVAVDSDQDKEAIPTTPAEADELSISGLQQQSLQLALEHSSADWLQQPPDTFVPLMGVPPSLVVWA
jgi:hypothetical protein